MLSLYLAYKGYHFVLIQVFAIELVPFAVDFIPLAVEFSTFFYFICFINYYNNKRTNKYKKAKC